MRNEFNDIPLINADGILQQDEWNRAVYSEYSMKPLEEDSSRKFVENNKQFSEFNELTNSEYSWEKEEEKKEDNGNQGKNVLQSASSSLAGTIVAALAGASRRWTRTVKSQPRRPARSRSL